MTHTSCWFCGATLLPSDYGRSDVCSQCGRDTRVCKGCGFYDPSRQNHCHEPQADPVADREKSNFCEYFRPVDRASSSKRTSAEELRAAAEALFTKKPTRLN